MKINLGAKLDAIFAIIDEGLGGDKDKMKTALVNAGFAVCDLKIELIQCGLIPNELNEDD